MQFNKFANYLLRYELFINIESKYSKDELLQIPNDLITAISELSLTQSMIVITRTFTTYLLLQQFLYCKKLIINKQNQELTMTLGVMIQGNNQTLPVSFY